MSGTVVQASLEAYNDHDAAAFAACFATDGIIRSLPDNQVIAHGHEEIKARYLSLFNRYPQVKAMVDKRVEEGSLVMDFEVISGKEQPAKALGVYLVKDGLITQAWYMNL